MEETVTDERVGVFTPDKDGDTADGAGCVPVIAAMRRTVCGEVGRVLRFPPYQVHFFCGGIGFWNRNSLF